MTDRPIRWSVEFNSNGSLRHFDHIASDRGPVSLNLFVGNEAEGGPANLYLRRLAGTIEWTPLLGPASPARFEADSLSGELRGSGTWRGIRYSIALQLAEAAAGWFWHVSLENTSSAAQVLDLTYAQDLALAPYGAVRMNEFYVSQYIDHTPLSHRTHGWVIATRQNQAADGRYPWCVTGSLREAVSFATDALQFYGYSRRSSEAPEGLTGDLPGHRLQHEHSMAVIRDRPIHLGAGEIAAAGFFGGFADDHPGASTAADLEFVDRLLSLPDSAPAKIVHADPPAANPASLFSAAPPLAALELDERQLQALFEPPWRHEEFDEQGKRLSFFCGEDRHVVLREKELRVLRPHGHLLRTGLHLTPDESGLTSTVWMNGVFHSMVTQGHVSINRFLSTVRSYLGLFRSHGLRAFADLGGVWRLLDLPSAFEMSPSTCRWIYRLDDGLIDVRSAAGSDPHELTLSIEARSGEPMRFLLTAHVALNGDDGGTPGAVLWTRSEQSVSVHASPDSDVGRRFPGGAFIMDAEPGTRFETVGGDEVLYADGRPRREPFVCMVCEPAKRVAIRVRATLVEERTRPSLRAADSAQLAPALKITAPESSVLSERALRLAEFLPWSAHNALVHYLSPRGLEQFSGGGWGTRDVCQGPVETLLAMGRAEPVRELLLCVMRNQNADGDWPQWFMFFERERGIRPDDSHGDIVFWPLLVLAQYVLASGDGGMLDERVPFFDSRGPAAGEMATLWDHARRALSLIERRVIPGTLLAAYGHGDWNDSLQPADPAMRERMCSSWTVTLNFQTLKTLARALRSIGRARDAAPLEERAEAIRRDFQRLLVVDGVLTGYAHFEDGGAVRYLLHPRDRSTGVSYSALAMIHAILEDLLTPPQIEHHLRLIDEHLHASDGVRLFDRPLPYHGGPQLLFQRAESATFFGREIGLMYTHAHLRYAQALAHLGEAERFFDALCRANPIGIRSIVPSATMRQANCYYSSSDAAFGDRYEASEKYDLVGRGAIALEGGWRVYSSGAGITLGLIVRHFLGLGREADAVVVDPVIPAALDGLEVRTELLGRTVSVKYRIGPAGSGVAGVTLNGRDLALVHDVNPHRTGAARMSVQSVLPLLAEEGNSMEIRLG